MADNEKAIETKAPAKKAPTKRTPAKRKPTTSNLPAERGSDKFAINPGELLQVALTSGQPQETISAIMEMRRELKAEWARERFYEDLSRFQSMCPSVPKKRVVMNRDGKTVRYHYASLDDIIEHVRGPLGECGFSWVLMPTQEAGNAVTATVRLTHKDGHHEESSITFGLDNSGNMSQQQAIGSANTYAKRYAFCNVTGIMTADEDDDAQGFSVGEVVEAAEEIKALKACSSRSELATVANSLWKKLKADDPRRKVVLNYYNELKAQFESEEAIQAEVEAEAERNQ